MTGNIYRQQTREIQTSWGGVEVVHEGRVRVEPGLDHVTGFSLISRFLAELLISSSLTFGFLLWQVHVAVWRGVHVRVRLSCEQLNDFLRRRDHFILAANNGGVTARSS